MKQLDYRIFDLCSENPDKLFALFEAAYDEKIDIPKWEWKYLKNPYSKSVRIYVAEDGDVIAGATYRLPYRIKLEGTTYPFYFNVDSMVHKRYRRLGIMQRLYEMACRDLPLTYSKNTAPGMYELLLKIGFKPIHPNTYLTCVLSMSKWLKYKFKLHTPSSRWKQLNWSRDKQIQQVFKFGTEFDTFQKRISGYFDGIVIKDAVYMNWRFFEIPAKEYRVFYRKKSGTIISVVVLGMQKDIAKIVDILWDPTEKGEPANTIRFAKSYFRKSGFLKVHCWATHARLRNALKKNLFFDRGMTPRFSAFAQEGVNPVYSEGLRLHFVEGDGDSDFG